MGRWGRTWEGAIAGWRSVPLRMRGAVGENPLLRTGGCHLDCLPWSVPDVMYCHWQLLPCPLSLLPLSPDPAPTNPQPQPHSTHSLQQGVPGVRRCPGTP